MQDAAINSKLLFEDVVAEPIVFVRSATSLALEKAAYLVVALIVAGACGYVAFGGFTLPTYLKIGLGFAVLIALWLSIRMLKEIRAVLADGRDWRVEITDTSLSWFSPVEAQMKSFEVQLSDIEGTQHTIIRRRNSKSRPHHKFYLKMLNRDDIKLDQQLSGISPLKVFKALESKGIKFEFQTVWRGSAVEYSVSK